MILSIVGLVIFTLSFIVFGLTGKLLLQSEEFIIRYVSLILAEASIEGLLFLYWLFTTQVGRKGYL